MRRDPRALSFFRADLFPFHGKTQVIDSIRFQFHGPDGSSSVTEPERACLRHLLRPVDRDFPAIRKRPAFQSVFQQIFLCRCGNRQHRRGEKHRFDQIHFFLHIHKLIVQLNAYVAVKTAFCRIGAGAGGKEIGGRRQIADPLRLDMTVHPADVRTPLQIIIGRG